MITGNITSAWKLIGNKIVITPPTVFDSTTIRNLLRNFADKAGPVLLKEIREILGSDTIYTLSDEYALRKPKDPRYVHKAGKSTLQPLILSGQHIYDALELFYIPEGFLVRVNPAKAQYKGFDVAAYWDEKTEYMQKALNNKEQELADILGQCVMDTLGL